MHDVLINKRSLSHKESVGDRQMDDDDNNIPNFL